VTSLRMMASVGLVVAGVLACGGTIDGPWGICATHHDAASCEQDRCLWLLAPEPVDVCGETTKRYTPLAKDGCFEDWAWGIRDRSPGCVSNDECPTGTTCVAKSFRDGAFNPSCDYANLCVATE